MARFSLFFLSSLVTVGMFFLIAKKVAPTLMSSLNHNQAVGELEYEPASFSSEVFYEQEQPEQPSVQSAFASNAPSRPVEVSERQFNRLSRQGVVLVKFGAEWCGPCRRVDKELQKLAYANAGDLVVLTVDIDREQALARRFNVGSIPHMLLLHDGQQVQQWVGFQSADRLQGSIRKATKPTGTVQSNPFTT